MFDNAMPPPIGLVVPQPLSLGKTMFFHQCFDGHGQAGRARMNSFFVFTPLISHPAHLPVRS